MMFAITVWWLWKWRCAFVFRQEQLDEKMKIQHLYRYLDQFLLLSKFSSSPFFLIVGEDFKAS